MRIEKQMLNNALRVLGKAVYQTSPVELYRSVDNVRKIAHILKNRA